MTDNEITAYITKFALTEGILPVKGWCERSLPSLFVFRRKDSNHAVYAHVEGSDWHRTEESAMARVERMRAAKINSLTKPLKKYQAFRPKIFDERPER